MARLLIVRVRRVSVRRRPGSAVASGDLSGTVGRVSRARRYHARPARPGASFSRHQGRRHSLHAQPRRSHPPGSTKSALQHAAKRQCHATATAAPWLTSAAHFSYVFEPAARWGGAFPESTCSRLPDRSVWAAPRSSLCRFHGARSILGFRIDRSRISPTRMESPSHRGRCSRASGCSSSTHCASDRTPRTSRSQRRSKLWIVCAPTGT